MVEQQRRRIPKTIKEEREVRILADRAQWRIIRQLQRENMRLHERLADMELAVRWLSSTGPSDVHVHVHIDKA